MSNLKITKGANTRKSSLLSCGVAALIAASIATPALALVTPAPVSPAAVVDTANTRPYWVGLAIRNEAGNSGGTCTGLLINPRTVLFAAHCVDGLTPAAYDGNAPGNRAQVGYTTDGTFGNTNMRNWLFGQDFVVPPGDGRLMTSSTMVWYDQRSRNGPGPDKVTGAFLPADVAIAGFDTPTELLGRDGANGIGLLFSQVNGLVPVTIGGYGQHGNGLTGARQTSPGDPTFFRRLGQNMLGFLGDERSIALGVYGSAIANITNPSSRTYQDLYWIDFDNPDAATQPFSALTTRNAATNTLDFDIFAGAAVAGETITAAGDSGSPLVTAAFGREVSLGVLSQGSRFFFDSIGNPNDNLVFSQVFSNYGTTAGYNPLFLFWDQILINNPYKYVGAKAGDGEWTDATRWEQELDPLYFTLAGTSLVNALPTAAPLGASDAATNVGTVRANPAPPATCAFLGNCPPTGGVSDTVNTDNRGIVNLGSEDYGYNLRVDGEDATPTPVNDGPHLLTGANASAAQSGTETQTAQDGTASLIGDANEANAATPAGPGGTLAWTAGRIALNSGALTGVGSTGFTPNNTNGTAGLQNSTRYFEVNLRNAGTTSMTATTATIDRLNVRGANSGLNIKVGSQLTTIMSSFVDAGRLNVDGIFAARQLNVLGGVVSGTGTINTTSGVLVAGGVLTPGAQGGVGTMAVTGGAGFGTAGVFGVDVASATSADRLNVTGNLVLGGGLSTNFLGGYVPDFGSSWTIANASGTLSGAFSAVMSNMTGVLRPRATINGNNLVLDIFALPFATFAACTTAECSAFSSALDTARASKYNDLKNLFKYVDTLPASQAREFLSNMAPWDNQIAGSNALTQGDVLSRMVFGRVQMAQADANSRYANRPVQYASANNGITTDAGETMATFNNKKGQMSIFGEVRSVRADADALGGFSGSKSDGYAIMLGIDKATPDYVIGAAIQSASSEGDTKNLLSNAESKSTLLTVYGGAHSGSLDYEGYFSFGQGDYDLTRKVGPFTMNGSTSGQVSGAGVAISSDMKKSWGSIVPRLSFVYDGMKMDGYTETGTAALSFGDREVETAIIRAGATFIGKTKESQKVSPWLSVFHANNLGPKTEGFGTIGFANAQTNFVPLTSAPLRDESWFETGIGLDADFGKGKLGLAYETTLGRDDVTIQSIRARFRLNF